MPDTPGFDLNFLSLFEALHHERNVSAAARTLGLSQPATSAALGRMRKRFGDPLFVRTSHGMVPTPLADEMAPAVRDALDTVRRRIAGRSSAEPASQPRTLRLSVGDASGMVLLPRIVQRLQQVAPQWRIETESVHPAALPRTLENGLCDLAMGNLYMLGTGIYRQRLLGTEYKVVHRRDHPRLHEGLSLQDYLAAGHAVMRSPGAPPSVLEVALARRGHHRRVVLTVPQFVLLPSVVAETDLIATVPAHVAQAFAGAYRLAVWPLPLPMPELVLYQYWHQRYHTDATNKWVRTTIRQVFGKPGGS